MASRIGGGTSGSSGWPRSAIIQVGLRLPGSIALSCLIAACAGTDTVGFPYFERLEVVPASPGNAMGEAETSGEKATRGVATGAASGAAAGLVVSLMCGPWYFECVSSMVPDMMATGGAVDAIAGGVTGLSAKDTERFNRYLENLPERRNLNEELAHRVAGALPPERLATESADARLTVGIGGIRVVQNEVNTLQVELTASAALDRDPGGAAPGRTGHSFTCTSEARGVDEWLGLEGRALDAAITSCVDKLAAEVNGALRAEVAR